MENNTQTNMIMAKPVASALINFGDNPIQAYHLEKDNYVVAKNSLVSLFRILDFEEKVNNLGLEDQIMYLEGEDSLIEVVSLDLATQLLLLEAIQGNLNSTVFTLESIFECLDVRCAFAFGDSQE